MEGQGRHTPEHVIAKPQEGEVKRANGAAIAQVCEDVAILPLGDGSVGADAGLPGFMPATGHRRWGSASPWRGVL
jgi:hypothetical protein